MHTKNIFFFTITLAALTMTSTGLSIDTTGSCIFQKPSAPIVAARIVTASVVTAIPGTSLTGAYAAGSIVTFSLF